MIAPDQSGLPVNGFLAAIDQAPLFASLRKVLKSTSEMSNSSEGIDNFIDAKTCVGSR
jgi:hypothetical protein